MNNVPKLKCVLVAFAVSMFSAVAVSRIPEGLAGERLMDAVARSSRPETITVSMTGAHGVWRLFRSIYGNDSGEIPDLYSDKFVPLLRDGLDGCDGLTADPVVPPRWWASCDRDYGDTLRYDLYNLVPCNYDVVRYKRDFPPGNVITVDYTNGFWSAGRGFIDGIEVNFYTPPRGYEGDFARTVFYMITLYPCDWWSGLGVNFCTSGRYPGILPYARRQLIAWHRADPVSALERRRNDVVERVQGNRNPFVDDPSLADYLWGDRAGEAYIPEPTDPDEPQPDEPLAPLKAVYSATDDTVVNLRSPYIPEDAVWSVDGVEVDAETVPVKQLGVGIHELKFVSGTLRGKVLIEIRQ